MSLPVVVVGAGIAGVSCARELAAAGIPVRVHERSYVAGGRMASRTLAGRRADVGPGPTADGAPAAAVVLAMPDPQASDLLADELTEELAAVDGRESAPAYALAAGWRERCWRDLDGAFVADDPDLTWVADDGR